MTIQVMTPGWGSSGYYSAEVCESAAELVAVGTQMYLDHPHQDGSGLDVHGNRSVRDIAAVITEAGRWDPDQQAVIAECTVTAPYREFLADEHLAPHIGLSIRGSATDVVEGEAEGRRGQLIESVAVISSVDFVSRAGRGGKVLQVLESAPPSAVIEAAVQRGIAEATADERREQLSDAIRTQYGSERRWAWVRDFDETTVWFEASSEDEPSRTWQQAYTVADDDLSVSLTGERTQVRPVTKYVPATRPDSTNPTTEESEEDTMGNISIEESEHRRLTEAAGRVAQLEERATTAERERDELREAAAVRTRTDRAVEIVEARAKEAGVSFTPREVKGLLADVTVTESGDLDEAAFTTLVDTDAAAKKADAGAGQVRGHGGTVVVTESGTPTGIGWGDIDSVLGIAEQKGA
ncbi:hypothetical protein [Nocardioides sp. Arc9.136]|uniref:hypothetical protein n=1 Tax=Nocardioides sp. Arc9.136 TaxID=2996826 RepID=UPI0026661CB2|nr:hypothetical protein [Nocardioides sp. Arc9.136]WKN47141.1 hypothetical protein OSR43_13945 [Nocardioides sp. Arc9.136]